MYRTNTSNNFMTPHEVTEDITFINQSSSAKYLYVILCKLANRYADEKGWFWRGIKNLSQDTGFNEKTVTRAKAELLENEFIDVRATFYEHSKKRTYDSYRLNGFRFKSGDKNGI